MRSRIVFQIFAIVIAICFLILFSITGVSVLQNTTGYRNVMNTKQSAKTNAEKLIHDLYGNRVVFQKEYGDGINYSARYYCANICVDACADGSVRYLCDIRESGGEDILMRWLSSQKDAVFLRTEAVGLTEYRYFQSVRCSAEICLHMQTGRIFAAKINFIS